MSLHRSHYRKAFTLIELSLVLLVLSILAASALRYTTARTDTSNLNATNATLDVVDTALLQYRNTYGRLPCPADITLAENNQETLSSIVYSFGQEIDEGVTVSGQVGVGSGSCTGANFTTTNFAAGAIPTRTLRLADKYAYDAWGRKIQYGVDTRMTATNAFLTYPIYYVPTANAFTVNNSYGNALTSSAIYPVYILISFGKNGHGAFVRNLSTTCTLSPLTCPVFNYGSTNSDELANCNCTKAAALNPFATTFVQDTPNVINGNGANTNAGVMFDDIVRYKTRAQMATTAELQ